MQGKRPYQKKSIAEYMENLRQRREDRKLAQEKRGMTPSEMGKMMDIDYERMIRKKKAEIFQYEPKPHTSSESSKISVIIRKRPLSRKENSNGEIDCVSCLNPKITIHECKIKIDGITKYLEDHEFYFDNTFSENESTEDVYNYTVAPMIDLVLNSGIVTCFAYGQTGSGKTFTMKGIQNLAIDSLFEESTKIKGKEFVFYISFFEIYGGRLYDLLNNKNKLQVLDDKKGNVHIFGLEEILTETPDDMRLIIDRANSIRTTHNTVTNETSSRSHAICNITIKESGSDEEYGKLSLVDLAGSERAQETQSNNRQRRAEGAEINKSLLALKECIRALDARKTSGNNDIHVPFRASKLTHVLRDSFVSKSDKSKIIMISCVSPSYCSSNHSINTLRYSDRLKEQTSIMSKQNNNNTPNYGNNSQRVRTHSSHRNNNINNNNNNINNNNNNNLHGNHHSNSGNHGNGKSGFGRDNNKKDNDKYYDINNINNEDDINMNVFNVKDDILNDINFDKLDIEDDIEFPKNNIIKNEEIENEGEEDDLLYLKKTSKDGKYISDDFLKYNKLTNQIVEDEDDIVNTHMTVIKSDAKMLTEEGELITKIKGIGGQTEDFTMDEYLIQLEEMVDKKISMYSNLKGKLDIYKKHIKEEDEMRKNNPQLFVDTAEI